MVNERLSHIYKDGDQWCMIYPLGSDIMSCQAVDFEPTNEVFNNVLARYIDTGFYILKRRFFDANPNIPRSYYCDEN